MTESKDKPVIVAHKSEPAKPIRVLLLDDRDENLFLRATILRKKGYEVFSASSVDGAQEQLQQIDIAVLDYHLGKASSAPKSPKSFGRCGRRFPSSSFRRL